MNKPTIIDLFCGAGGLSFGFSQAGYEVIAGFDCCSDSISTFEKNHAGSSGNLCDLSRSIANLKQYKGVDIVVGGPPCQGFSISGKRDPEDERNLLYKAYIKTLKVIKPKIFLMENVPNLASMDSGNILLKIIADLSKIGYKITYEIINSADFGVPQSRKRIFILGCMTKAIYLPAKDAKLVGISCKQAISDLPDKTMIDGSKYPIAAKSDYQKIMRKNSNGIWNHQLTNHTDKTKKIISLVPDGGNYKDLPNKYKETRKVNIAWTRFNSKKPSLTIDTGHRHHFHYKFDRVPTVRESARLQSFPDAFHFSGSKTSQYRQVGNAVPPLLATKIANFLKKEFK